MENKVLLKALFFVSKSLLIFTLAAFVHAALAQSLSAADPSCNGSLPAPRLQGARSINDSARIMAGLEVDSDSDYWATSQTQAWRRYSAQLSTSFERLKERQLRPLDAWAARELGNDSAAMGPVFYPFSGPDLVYALNLFPSAQSFILTGLEPVGEVPNLDAIDVPALDRRLRSIANTLYALLEFSFFRTNDMTANLKGEQIAGVLPVLMLFLERMDYEILSIARFRLDTQGQWCALDEARLKPNDVAGVRVHFLRRGEQQVRQLLYLRADIGDSGLQRTPQYARLIDAMAPHAVLLKAASYLQHKSYFSAIAAMAMAHAKLLLQDDSGIPHRKFSPDAWDATAYGRYAGPIPLFANWRQADLAALFARQKPTALSFSFGYQHRDSGIVVYRKRPGAKPEAATPSP